MTSHHGLLCKSCQNFTLLDTLLKTTLSTIRTMRRMSRFRERGGSQEILAGKNVHEVILSEANCRTIGIL